MNTKTCVTPRFSEHAAGADQQDRAPLWIVACPNDQLEALVAHALQESTIKFDFRACCVNVGVKGRPSLQQFFTRLIAKNHAACIALVR
jgi:hypothetical protein